MIAIALFVIGTIITIYMFSFVFVGACAVLYGVGVAIQAAWKKLNSLGRAVFFGIPLLVAVYFIFFFIFYILIPFFLVNEVERIFCLSVFGFIAYFGLYFIGWCESKYDTQSKCMRSPKRLGVLPLIARIIFLLPYMPVLYVGFYIKQIFCKAFISDSQVCWVPHFITIKPEEHVPVKRKARRKRAMKDAKRINSKA